MEDARLRGIDRGYHSTAVLMPDATVLSAGSGEFFDDSKKPKNPIDSHRQAQIFHPPYLLRGPRPQVIDSPEEVDYGSEFPVRILGPEVGRVSWIRLSSVTHAFNENQFINFLKFRSGNDGLIVTAPARPELSPPGHYMLFVLSKDGVPSESRVLRIGPSAPRPHLALTSALAAAEQHYYREGKTPIEIEDEEILRQSTGTRVTIGLTARCPYGLATCWAGAYEALTKLSGVEAVRPIANSDTSTADLFLRGQILPDLDRWPEEFAEWANRSYDFRGVEVKSRRRASGGGRRIRADRTHLPRAGAAASVGAGHEGPMGLCGAKAARGHIR
jgi:galactose oxidase